MEEYPVLVIGGCGFVGYHIVEHLVQTPGFSPITVFSRSAATSANKVDGANYISGDLASRETIERVIRDVRPSIIINAASPSTVTGTPRDYQHIVIDGTKTLLEVATKSTHVRVLIYTSSSTIAKGHEHPHLDESAPLADEDPSAPAYARAKATAEKMVLKAHHSLSKITTELNWSGRLSTSAIRLPICYGTHDTMSIPGCLAALEKGQTNVQLGDGKNLWDFCSTHNAATAHVLLARRLLEPPAGDAINVGGEAFHIHDDQMRPFWDFARTVWKLAGHKKQGERVIQLPVWFLWSLAILLEWLFWAVTLGRKRPQNLGKQQIEYACYSHSYNLTKARKRLGYVPEQNFQAELQKAVNWSLERNWWGERLQWCETLISVSILYYIDSSCKNSSNSFSERFSF